jgi:peptidylprolyl isomerase
VTYFKTLSSTILRARGRLGLLAAVAGAAILIAGCGSSGSSSTITVGNENSADNSLIKETASSSSSTSTSTTASAKTPTSGPLSKEPKVTVPTGPAPTKLETKELITGTGAEAKDGDSVTVNYVGVLYKTGKEFNASWETKEPFPFTLGKGEVIKGWDEGIPGMKVGGRRELIIPASLAYGTKGSPPKIPGNEALVFVVDLLGV